MYFLLTVLRSSTELTLIFALHGPTRSMVSRDAAISAVSVPSSEEGIVICPVDFPDFVVTITSIRPMRPVLWSSRKSSSAPRRPSVCPNNAPITSGFSTTPSASKLPFITYFTDVCANFAMIITYFCI